jgi:hypothetical protein
MYLCIWVSFEKNVSLLLNICMCSIHAFAIVTHCYCLPGIRQTGSGELVSASLLIDSATTF